MTETKPTYATPTRQPPSEWAIDTLARSLYKVFKMWRKTYPAAHFSEEVIRRICELALTKLEGENDGNV